MNAEKGGADGDDMDARFLFFDGDVAEGAGEGKQLVVRLLGLRALGEQRGNRGRHIGMITRERFSLGIGIVVSEDGSSAIPRHKKSRIRNGYFAIVFETISLSFRTA